MGSSRDNQSSAVVMVLVLMTFGLLSQMPSYCSYVVNDIPHDRSEHMVPLMLLVVSFALLYYGTNLFRHDKDRGPLADSSDWPDPIRRIHSFLNDAGVETESFTVYLLDGKPNRVLSTVVCRLSVDDDGWKAIREKLELQPVSESVGGSIRDSVISRSDESWWPVPSESVEYFAGEEADPYTAARDKAASRVFILYEYN
jgi:hypothetical protein